MPSSNPDMHVIPYGDETIRFTLRRQPARTTRTIAIHVEPDGRVIVDAPESAQLSKVLEAVRKRSRWISSHLGAVQVRLANVLPREYVSGETCLYLGRRYLLKVVMHGEMASGARMRGAYLEVVVPERELATVRAQLDGWFRLRAREVFSERLRAIASSLPWVKTLPPVRLQRMKVQWGSCSPSGRLTLNPLLVKAPRECVDYVMLHELCHLRHHNHSKDFYKVLDRYMPRWREIKDRLDGMAERILCE